MADDTGCGSVWYSVSSIANQAMRRILVVSHVPAEPEFRVKWQDILVFDVTGNRARVEETRSLLDSFQGARHV
jgi:hypothetical protein